jgi:hypothetical protein
MIAQSDNDLKSITNGISLRGYHGLADLIPGFHKYHTSENKRCNMNCFKQFSITHDRTPYFAEAFAVVALTTAPGQSNSLC